MLRVGKEAVANIVKHANAERVTITFHYAPDTVSLVVEDDGQGLGDSASSDRQPTHGWGIVGMRERATRLGGTLDISAIAEGGVRVTLCLPTT